MCPDRRRPWPGPGGSPGHGLEWGPGQAHPRNHRIRLRPLGLQIACCTDIRRGATAHPGNHRRACATVYNRVPPVGPSDVLTAWIWVALVTCLTLLV